MGEIRSVVLTVEQRELVESLSSTVCADQALWLSAYFDGLSVGRKRSDEPRSPAIEQSRRLSILFGSETGNAIEIAQALADRASSLGLAPTLIDMADYTLRNLTNEEDVLIVTSTHGEGDPPQPALGFFEFVESRKAPKLDRTRYAVLALGDSGYEHYCEAGKRLDRRLEELGARRLAERVDCDVDYAEPAETWRETVLRLLDSTSGAKPGSSSRNQPGGELALVPKHDKRNPFPATVIDNLSIVGRGSSKDTRHVELSLSGSGLSYEPGDALGIMPSNDPSTVMTLLDALEFEVDEGLEFGGERTTVGEALTRQFEIARATPRFLDQWARWTGAIDLKRLLQEDCAAERTAFLNGHHIIDIVKRFPCPGISAADFVTGLRSLQPRLYSLSFSQDYAPEEAHLTVVPVRYELHGEARTGICSGQIAERLEPGATLPVYVQGNAHFHLPDDDAAIILIGAGTGVAPFRAFLQHREIHGAKGRSWLFFGERNFGSDFLYQTEWQRWLKDGNLDRMSVAFSRDTKQKIYVQHRLREHGREIFSWLEEGAHVYVCGDASNLAPGVNEALIDIVAEESRSDRDAAEDYVRNLTADHRYHRDVY